MRGSIGSEAGEDEHGDLIEIHVVEGLEIGRCRAEERDKLEGCERDRKSGHQTILRAWCELESLFEASQRDSHLCLHIEGPPHIVG